MPVSFQDSYPNHPNHCNLRKLPQNLVPAPRSLLCELPFSLDVSFSDLTVATGYCSYGLDYPLSLSTLDNLYVVNAFPPGLSLLTTWQDGPPPVPGIPGCYLADGSTIIFFDFLMLLIFELGRFLILGNPGCMMQMFLEQLSSF